MPEAPGPPIAKPISAGKFLLTERGRSAFGHRLAARAEAIALCRGISQQEQAPQGKRLSMQSLDQFRIKKTLDRVQSRGFEWVPIWRQLKDKRLT
jgi:hypothetical protein